MVRSREVERSRAVVRRDVYVDVVCIGILMRCTGLEDLLGCAFAGVPNKMNGKAWPKTLRALRMVTTSLLDEVHYRGITIVDLQAELEQARKLPTGRQCVESAW